MKTLLLLIGTLLTPATACESHSLVHWSQLTLRQAAQTLAQPAAKAPATRKQAPPAAPVQPAPSPTGKRRPAPKLPPHLFM